MVETPNPKSADEKVMDLSEAVRIVNEAIKAETKRLEQISDKDNQIMLDGETTTGHIAHLMVDPSIVAQILLKYDYPTISILDNEAPQSMWDELGRRFGLAYAFGVDI